MYDLSLVMTKVATPYVLDQAEEDRVLQSLRCNGVAAVVGFVPPGDVAKLKVTTDAVTRPDFTLGGAMRMESRPYIDQSVAEFSHPFLVSDEASRIVTNSALLNVVHKFLGAEGVVHSAILQKSFPRREPAVDWHIDCGSNKQLNGGKRFRDKRLRTILYLTDVESGGLGFICGSAEAALEAFLSRPEGELFPQTELPPKAERRIEIDAPAGTLVFFDTHSLHRPEAPKQLREVMNIWFARRDFSAGLPATLFSLSRIPIPQRQNIFVFESERGHDPLRVQMPKNPPHGLVRRLLDAFKG